MHIEVIVGTSIFNGRPCVGLALKGQTSASGLCKAAEAASISRGRPAGTQTLDGRTEAEQISYLVGRWQEWATHNNISLTIKNKPRQVGEF